MNSIAAYCMAHLIEDFIAANLKTHLGRDLFKSFGTGLRAVRPGRRRPVGPLADPVLDVPAEAVPEDLR